MKTFQFIIILILGLVIMFMWFLLSESNRINNDVKSESWELTQEKTQLDQLIRALNTEIRELKASNQNWANLTDSCGSEKGEIRYLKSLNSRCITGLEQCIELIK